MVIGVLRVELAIYGALSLKDKRRVVKSLKDRISARFNASVAEVEALEARQRAVVAVAVVANETPFVESCLQQILNLVQQHHGSVLVNSDMEFL
ncbi:MAG: hypothetical protein HJJLKODD_02571 [Phycisphaerae bacterium]|nr:hypothetical protein [Phycisphaerae bacterium]